MKGLLKGLLAGVALYLLYLYARRKGWLDGLRPPSSTPASELRLSDPASTIEGYTNEPRLTPALAYASVSGNGAVNVPPELIGFGAGKIRPGSDLWWNLRYLGRN